MPCLFGCFALLIPRVVIVVVALTSNFLRSAYDTAIIPLLGFIFLPTTTLAYAWAVNAGGRNVSGIYLVVVVVAVLIDLGLLSGGASGGRYRKYWRR